MYRWLTSLIIVTAASLFVTQFYLSPGLPGTDDGIWAPVRLGSMYRELRAGQFPVRWSADLNYGYGYPLFHFSYPGVYYLGVLLVPFGLGLLNTTKLIFVISVVSAAVGIYALAILITKKHLHAVCSALLYLFSPYLFTNLYLRGSIGELAAVSTTVWIMLVLHLIIKQKKYFLTPIAALLVGALILAHNVTALLSLPAIGLFASWQASTYLAKAKSFAYKIHLLIVHLFRPFITFSLGLLVSIFFWLPALLDVQFTKLAIVPLTDISYWFVQPQKTLLYPFFSSAGPAHLQEYHLSVGLSQLILFVGAVVSIILRRNYSALIWVLVCIAYLLLTMPFTGPVWQHTPLLKSVDFPWRLLAPLSVLLALAPIFYIKNQLTSGFMVVITAVAIYTALPMLTVRGTLLWPNSQFATSPSTTTSADEYRNRWLPGSLQQHPAAALISVTSDPNFTFQTLASKSTIRSYSVSSTTNQIIEAQIMYFPGWQVKVNGQDTPIDFQSSGLIRFNVSPGTSLVEIKFASTPLQRNAEAVSLATFSVLVLMIIANLRRQKVQS